MSNGFYKYSVSHSSNTHVKDNWIYVTAVGDYYHSSDAEPFYRDYNPGYQFFYSIGGKGWFDYKGNYQIIEPNSLVCLNLEKRHGIGALEGHTWKHYWIMCGGKIFDYMYNLIFEKTNIYHPSNYNKYKLLFEQILNLKKQNDVYFDIKAMNIILEMMTGILNDTPSIKTNTTGHLNFIEGIVNYIGLNIEKELSVNKLAEISGYSVFHFSRIFKSIPDSLRMIM